MPAKLKPSTLQRHKSEGQQPLQKTVPVKKTGSYGYSLLPPIQHHRLSARQTSPFGGNESRNSSRFSIRTPQRHGSFGAHFSRETQKELKLAKRNSLNPKEEPQRRNIGVSLTKKCMIGHQLPNQIHRDT